MADMFAKWRSGLAKSSKAAFGRIATVFGATEITEDTWDELEALLIQADLGIETTTEILDDMRRIVQDQGLTRADELSSALLEELRLRLDKASPPRWTNKPTVIMMVGGNGSGKTKTIA